MFTDFFVHLFCADKQLIEALGRDAFEGPGKVQDRQPGS